MKHHLRNHLLVMALSLILLPAAVAAMNALVDPYRAYQDVAMSMFEPHRRTRGRRTKAILLERGDLQVVLMGSSRCETALDPSHPGFAAQRVFNLGLNRYNVAELLVQLEYAARHNRLKHAIVCLDFFGFNPLRHYEKPFDPMDYTPARALAARRTGAIEFSRSRFNPKRNRLLDHASMLLGRDATSDSIKLLRRWIASEPNSYTITGLRTSHRKPGDTRRLFATSLRGSMRSTINYQGWRYGRAHRDAVEKIIALARQCEFRLTFLFLPIHALQHEAIHAVNLRDDWEAWMRDLVDIVDRGNSAAPDMPPVTLWDFQGYNRFTTEPVPQDEHDRTPRKYFHDSSHCSRAVGNAVLDRITSHGTPPDDAFGMRLTSALMDQHLAAQRIAREAYRDRYSDQIEFFDGVIDKFDR